MSVVNMPYGTLRDIANELKNIREILEKQSPVIDMVPIGTNVECYVRNCEKNKNSRCERADVILEFGCGDYKKREG